MTLALLAALTIVSGYAALQHIAIRRMAAPLVTGGLQDATEAGEALLDVVEASLAEEVSEWEAIGDGFTHRESGFRISAPTRNPRLFKGGVEIALTSERRASLMRAIELNNARHALLALASDDE